MPFQLGRDVIFYLDRMVSSKFPAAMESLSFVLSSLFLFSFFFFFRIAGGSFFPLPPFFIGVFVISTSQDWGDVLPQKLAKGTWIRWQTGYDDSASRLLLFSFFLFSPWRILPFFFFI